MDFYLICRIMNVVLGAGLVIYLVWSREMWFRLINKLRDHDPLHADMLQMAGYALVLYIAANTYAGVESAYKHIPGGWRTWIITVSLLMFVLAFLWPVARRRYQLRREQT